MRIHLIGDRIATTPGLVDFVHTRLAAALDRFEPHIPEVRVRITDINGPKGGADKRCTIMATVGNGSPMIAGYVDTDFYAAISKAIATLKSAAGRRIQRGHVQRRGSR